MALWILTFPFLTNPARGKTRKIIDDNAAETHTIVAHLIPDNVGVVVTPLMIIGLSFAVHPLLGLLLLVLIAIGAWLVKGMIGEKELHAALFGEAGKSEQRHCRIRSWYAGD